MALLFNTTKNHLLGCSNRALCTVLWKMNCSISARTLVSQLHCLPASVSCSPNTLSAHRKLAPNTSSVKTSLLKSSTILGFLVLNCRQFSSESSIPVTLWKLGRLNHIAIAVPDLDKATAFYSPLQQPHKPVRSNRAGEGQHSHARQYNIEDNNVDKETEISHYADDTCHDFASMSCSEDNIYFSTIDLPKNWDVLKAKVSAPQPLPTHGVTTVFVELDNTKIELLLPLGDMSPIQKFLEKNKSGGLHHVCLEVDAIDEAVATVKRAGIRCLSPTTRIGAHGKPVMFLHPADCGGVLLELEQA